MPEPAFLVEGQMEQRIIQRLCPGRLVRRIGCNGDSVSMTGVSKAINLQMRTLKNFHPIVIVFDREGRSESCDVLISELSQIMDGNGYQGRYILGIADRMIENWILSDWEHICSHDDQYNPLTEDPESCHGKSAIRRLMPQHTIYHETTIGVELFLKCRSSEMFKNSKSFREFASKLTLDCYWSKNMCLPTLTGVLD